MVRMSSPTSGTSCPMQPALVLTRMMLGKNFHRYNMGKYIMLLINLFAQPDFTYFIPWCGLHHFSKLQTLQIEGRSSSPSLPFPIFSLLLMGLFTLISNGGGGGGGGAQCAQNGDFR